MVMVRSVVLFNFKLRKAVLVEYSHPKRYYNSGEKNIKKHFLVYSKNDLGAASWLKKNKRSVSDKNIKQIAKSALCLFATFYFLI